MTQFAGPFNSGAGANFDELKWRRMLGTLFPDGVITNPPSFNTLNVTAGTGLAVNVDTGAAILNGEYYSNDASVALTLTPDATNPRYYLIVVHLNETGSTDSAGVSARSGAAYAIAGTPASSPSVPTVTQTADTTWELALAQVLVPANAASSAAYTITDVRAWAGPAINRSVTSRGITDQAWGTTNGGPSSNGKITLGVGTVEVHARASHNGSDQDVIQTVPDTTGSGPAEIIVGGNPSQGIKVRLGNMSVFTGTGPQSGVAHGLGQIPSIIIVSPLTPVANPAAADQYTSTTCRVTIANAVNWIAIAIAQS